jgi:hypothetical protein
MIPPGLAIQKCRTNGNSARLANLARQQTVRQPAIETVQYPAVRRSLSSGKGVSKKLGILIRDVAGSVEATGECPNTLWVSF